MERDETTTADDLDRPEGNSLLENYDSHDTGMQYVVDRFAEAEVGADLSVEEWGIDRRHDAGDEGVIYDDKMDLKVYEDGEGTDDELVGIVEVKTKTSSKWMGQFNLRHYEDYVDIAAEHEDCFTWLVMLHIDGDDVLDGFIWFIDDHPSEDVMRSDEDESIYSFPDGNGKVILPHSCRATLDVFDNALTVALHVNGDHETVDRA